MSEQKQQVKRPQRYDADVVETYEEDSGHWMIASEADAYMSQQDARIAELEELLRGTVGYIGKDGYCDGTYPDCSACALVNRINAALDPKKG